MLSPERRERPHRGLDRCMGAHLLADRKKHGGSSSEDLTGLVLTGLALKIFLNASANFLTNGTAF